MTKASFCFRLVKVLAFGKDGVIYLKKLKKQPFSFYNYCRNRQNEKKLLVSKFSLCKRNDNLLNHNYFSKLDEFSIKDVVSYKSIR